jgi:uncharacterized membrane protein YjjP (DUF1212 family)
MSDPDPESPGLPMAGKLPPPAVRPGEHSKPEAAALGLISTAAKQLFANGQTTERMAAASENLAEALGFPASIFPRWGELVIRIEDHTGVRYEIVPAEPAGMDMNKVTAVMTLIDKACQVPLDMVAVRSAMEAIARFPPVSLGRFAIFAAAGAAALGVIFGTTHLLTLALIAFSAGAGACLRRWLAGMTRNLFVQPFCAALLAGVVGAIVIRFHLSSVLRLVAVCPAMVLVPGPHFLNGMIDLARARIPLGAARIAYAGLVTVMICTGLLLGLALGGTALPAAGPSHPAPFIYDVIAAGVAVAAYGTFFAMPWRMLPIPILIGMLAHAARWEAIYGCGSSPEAGALVACLVVGIIITPIADRLHLPFAGVAFASVVSLIPGVFLFRMAGGMLELVTLGSRAPQEISFEVLADGTTALFIILAMSFGLILPKMLIQSLLLRNTKKS